MLLAYLHCLTCPASALPQQAGTLSDVCMMSKLRRLILSAAACDPSLRLDACRRYALLRPSLRPSDGRSDNSQNDSEAGRCNAWDPLVETVRRLQLCYLPSRNGQRGEHLCQNSVSRQSAVQNTSFHMYPGLQVPEAPPELAEWSQNTSLGVFAGLIFGGLGQWLRDRQAGTRLQL